MAMYMFIATFLLPLREKVERSRQAARRMRGEGEQCSP